MAWKQSLPAGVSPSLMCPAGGEGGGGGVPAGGDGLHPGPVPQPPAHRPPPPEAPRRLRPGALGRRVGRPCVRSKASLTDKFDCPQLPCSGVGCFFWGGGCWGSCSVFLDEWVRGGDSLAAAWLPEIGQDGGPPHDPDDVDRTQPYASPPAVSIPNLPKHPHPRQPQ